jgi:hypothetical protein
MDKPTTDAPVAAGLAHRHTLDCRNCGAPAPELFCPRCGQETAEHLPSFREFAHEFVLHYLAAEGKLWRTLRALVSRPGYLTLEYLRGRKLAYVQPLRLYLTLSIVFFLILKLTTSAVNLAADAPNLQREIESGKLNLYFGFAFWSAERHSDGSFSCNLPQSLCDRIKPKLFAPSADLEKLVTGLPRELFSHFSSAMFVLLPLFALYLKTAYLRRTYGEHFLFALHLHSLWFLVLVLTLAPLSHWVNAAFLVYLFVFSFMSLQRVYGGPVWQTLVKGIGVAVAYVASLLAMTTIIGIWAIVE